MSLEDVQRPRVGRPRKGTPINDRLPDDLAAELTTTAQRARMPRAELLRRLVAATLPHFRRMVLDEPDTVLRGSLCPLCYGQVDGPHKRGCGYYGPLVGHDHREDDDQPALDRETIGVYYDNTHADAADAAGIPEEVQQKLRERYIDDVLANPKALAELREILARAARWQRIRHQQRHSLYDT